MTTYTTQLEKCIKGKYGQWLLMQLPSGRWAGVWDQTLGLEPECREILKEVTWFYTKLDERDEMRRVPSFSKRSASLDWIRMQLEETRQEYGPKHDDYYLPLLKTVRLAMRRSQTKEAREESDCPLVRELTLPAYRSLLLL